MSSDLIMIAKSKEQMRQRVIGILLVFLGGILLFVFAVILFFKITAPRDIGFLLPKEETVFFLEADVSDASQEPAFAELLQAFSSWLSSTSGISFENISGVASFAYVRDIPILFFETHNRSQTKEALLALRSASEEKRFSEEDIEGTPVFSFPLSQLFYFTFINRYLVVSPQKEGIRMIIQTSLGEKPHLRQNMRYLSVMNMLPRERLLRGYFGFPQTTDAILFSGLGGPLVQFLATQRPLVDLVQSIGVSGKMRDAIFTLKTFFSFRPGVFFVPHARYRGKLLKFLPPETVHFFGGTNIKEDVTALIDALEKHDRNGSLFLRGALSNFLTETLGFMPDAKFSFLLENEYAVGMLPNGGVVGAVALPKKLPPTFAEELPSLVQHISAHLFPQTQDVILSDGTTGKEKIPNPSFLEQKTWDSFVGFTPPGKEVGLFAGISDDILFFGTTRAYIEQMIAQGKNDLVLNDAVWERLVSSALVTANHVFGFSFKQSLLPMHRGLASVYIYPSGMIWTYAFPVE